MVFISWSGPTIQSDIGWLVPQVCVTIVLANLAGQSPLQTEEFVAGLVLTFLLWQHAVQLPVPLTLVKKSEGSSTSPRSRVVQVLSSTIELYHQFAESNQQLWQQSFGSSHGAFLANNSIRYNLFHNWRLDLMTRNVQLGFHLHIIWQFHS